MVTHFTVIGLGGSPNETFFLHNLLCLRLATALSTGRNFPSWSYAGIATAAVIGAARTT
jgi:hypothetical protein